MSSASSFAGRAERHLKAIEALGTAADKVARCSEQRHASLRCQAAIAAPIKSIQRILDGLDSTDWSDLPPDAHALDVRDAQGRINESVLKIERIMHGGGVRRHAAAALIVPSTAKRKKIWPLCGRCAARLCRFGKRRRKPR